MNIRFTTVRILSTFSVVLVIAFGVSYWQTDAFTQLGITITTNDDLERGLVAHWTFDGEDMTSTVADRSTSGNDGNLILGASGNTATTTRPGPVGQGLEFDGTDDYVYRSVPDPFSTPSGSVCVWLNADTVTSTQYIFSSADESVNTRTFAPLRIDGSNQKMSIYMARDSGAVDVDWVEGDTALSANRWHHACAVADGSTYKIFIDGNEETLTVRTGSNSGVWFDDATGKDNFVIGAGLRTSLIVPFNGSLDDLRVYDRALSDSEITRLYALGATTKIAKTLENNVTLETGLVGHWTFDGEDMTSTVADRSTSGNDGNLILGASGNTSTTTRPGPIGQALELDGGTDYIDIGGAEGEYDFAEDFTFSLWLKPSSDWTDDSFFRTIFSKWNSNLGYQLAWSNGDYLYLYLTNGIAVDTNGTLSSLSQEWHHVVVVVRPGTTNSQIFVDGVDYSANQLSRNASDSSVSVRIGATAGSPVNYTDAHIDDIRIYNRALSATEITRLYGLGATTKIAKTVTPVKTTLDTGLVGHWTFDGPTMYANVGDSSTSGNDGNLILGASGNTSTTTRPGPIGQALEFDGTDDYVDIQESGTLLPSSQITISAWSKSNGDGDQGARGMLVSAGTTYFDRCAGQPLFSLNNGAQRTLYAGSCAPEGEWMHYVGTYDGSVMRLYIDGVEVGSLNTSGAITDSAVQIGKWTNGSSYRVNGDIDDVRIYNRALSADEITRLYNLGR